VEAIEIYGLVAIAGAHAHEVALIPYHVDQLELLEHGGDGGKALANLGPRLNRDTQRRGVVKNEAQECVSDQPLAPVGHEEIKRCQMGQPYFALLITHCKVVPAAVVKVADTGDAYAVTIDDNPRHHSQFRPPRAIMRRRD